MSRRTATIGADYFDALYRDKGDPWQFRTSDYERAKYEDTLALLSRPRYETALEVGCSIGVFTRQLAARCDRLTAMDPSAVALATARDAFDEGGTVTFQLGAAPQDLPTGPFDLIVLSEVLYYFVEPDAEATMRRCCDRLAGGGEIILCHWLGETDYPLTGAAAASLALRIGEDRGFTVETRRRAHYRLDRLLKPAAQSEGL